MRKEVQTRMFASLAVLAVTGAPVSVANAAGSQSEAAMSAKDGAANKAEIAKWPAEKQAAYGLWPAETKAYYWTLSQERQKLFWGLTDTDKVALSGMSAPDQAKAWARIEGRGGASEGRRCRLGSAPFRVVPVAAPPNPKRGRGHHSYQRALNSLLANARRSVSSQQAEPTLGDLAAGFDP